MAHVAVVRRALADMQEGAQLLAAGGYACWLHRARARARVARSCVLAFMLSTSRL